MFKFNDVRKSALWLLVALCSFETTLAAAELKQSFPIRGTVRDISQSTSASGIPLQVHFQQIQYSGNVTGATIENSGEHYNVEMTLQNVTLRIGRTSIKSSFLIGADAGPISIRLGTRNDLRVRYKIAIEQDNVRVVSSSLELADDNWEIGRPSSVKTSGFGVTKERVVNGLRSGLRENRASIENSLIEQSPLILAPMKSTILAHVSPNPAPSSETSEETSVASKASVAENPAAASPANGRPNVVEEAIKLVSADYESNADLTRIDDREWSGFEAETAPPVGELAPRPPTIRLRHRVRSLLRGTIGLLGFAN